MKKATIAITLSKNLTSKNLIDPAELMEWLDNDLQAVAEIKLSAKGNRSNQLLKSRGFVAQHLPDLITVVGPLIGSGVTMLINSLLKFYKERNIASGSVIKLKGKSGQEVHFPANTSEEKLKMLLEATKSLDEIVKIELTESQDDHESGD